MTVTSIAATALVLSALMALAWLLALKTRNSGWSDVFWSYEMGLGGVVLALVPWGHSPWPWLGGAVGAAVAGRDPRRALVGAARHAHPAAHAECDQRGPPLRRNASGVEGRLPAAAVLVPADPGARRLRAGAVGRHRRAQSGAGDRADRRDGRAGATRRDLRRGARPTSSSSNSPPTRRTRARSATPVFGVGRVTRTISSNGSAGSPTRSSRRTSIPTLGDIWRCRGRSSCSCCCATCPACRRWSST